MKKRIISMLLVGAMLFTSIPMTATAKTSERKYGDVNGDGEIDFIDVLTLKKHIAEMEKKNYVSPEFLVEELRAEFGFAISGAAENDPYDYEKLTW